MEHLIEDSREISVAAVGLARLCSPVLQYFSSLLSWQSSRPLHSSEAWMQFPLSQSNSEDEHPARKIQHSTVASYVLQHKQSGLHART